MSLLIYYIVALTVLWVSWHDPFDNTLYVMGSAILASATGMFVVYVLERTRLIKTWFFPSKFRQYTEQEKTEVRLRAKSRL